MRMCRVWNVPNCRDCGDCGDCTDQAQHIEEVAPGVESWCCHWSAKWANASSVASQCDGNWMKLKLLLGNEPQKNSNSNIRTIYSWSEALSESSSRVHAGKSAPKSHKYICPASQQSLSMPTGRWAMHNKDKPWSRPWDFSRHSDNPTWEFGQRGPKRFMTWSSFPT